MDGDDGGGGGLAAGAGEDFVAIGTIVVLDCEIDGVIIVVRLENVAAGVAVVNNEAVVMGEVFPFPVEVEVKSVEDAARVAEFPVPGFAAVASAIVVEERVLGRLMTMLLLSEDVTLTLRRTFVHRRPRNVVTDEDIRMASLRNA